MYVWISKFGTPAIHYLRTLLFFLQYPQPSSSWDAALTEAIEKLLSSEILSSEEVKLHLCLFLSAATSAIYT